MSERLAELERELTSVQNRIKEMEDVMQATPDLQLGEGDIVLRQKMIDQPLLELLREREAALKRVIAEEEVN